MPMPSAMMEPGMEKIPNRLSPYEQMQQIPDSALPDEGKSEQDKLDAEERQTEYNELFVWEQAKPFLTGLVQQFETESLATKGNRERRLIDADIKAMQDKGEIKRCDTFIPQRVIEEGIQREKPTYVAYLQQSRRLAIFADVLYPKDKHDDMELAFTKGLQYEGWLDSHTQVIDGGQLHGWDCSETLFDSSKPLCATVDFVGHDRLIFPLSCEDIQNCTRVMRLFKWTRLQLKTFVKKHGFDADQVRKIISSGGQKDGANSAQKDIVFNIYKVYFKFEGIVYIAWASLEGCDGWLKKPEKFYNGVDKLVKTVQPQPPATVMNPDGTTSEVPVPPTVEESWQPVDETEYPLNFFIYERTEQKEIANSKGRAFKDKFKQEAMTVGWTSFLNGHNRATMLMGSKAENDGKSASQSQNLEIGDGKILPFKVDWHKLPYPDPSMLQALQVFDSKIATANGQMTYAVQNKSSGARTTKAEVNSAERDTTLLASVNVSMFASYVRSCYSKAWRIVQSQALQDNIQFYGQIEEVPPNPITGETADEPDFINDKAIIKRKYDIRPAGDVDYVQRTEMISDMMQFWQVVQDTPIAADFLAYLLKIKFGELGDMWAAKLLQGDMKSQLLMQCAKILQGLMMNPAEAMQMQPNDKMNLQMLIQQIQMALTPVVKPSQENSNTASNGQPKSNNNDTGNSNPEQNGGHSAGNSPVAQPSAKPSVLPNASATA